MNSTNSREYGGKMQIDLKKCHAALRIISLIILAVALRMVFLSFQTADMTTFFLKWYHTLLKVGRIDALGTNFYNYSPAYIYLIDIMTLFPWIPKLVAIKLILIFFDFLAAIAVYKLIGINTSSKVTRWTGFFSILFLPTVFIESSLWGQADIIYTTFLLWSLFLILIDHPVTSIIGFSIGLCFKFQAIFFLPVLLILSLHKKIKFYWFILIPVVYIISVIPCWARGRSLFELLTIYFQQAVTYSKLSMRAPNPYIFIDSRNNFEMKVYVGIWIAAVVSIGYILFRWRKWKRMDFYAIVFDAALFTTLLPFMLPKMHERYFFTGCIFMLVLAIFDHKQIPATILLQASLLLSFIPYLCGWSDNWVKIAAVINTISVLLFLYFGKWLLVSTDFYPDKLAFEAT